MKRTPKPVTYLYDRGTEIELPAASKPFKATSKPPEPNAAEDPATPVTSAPNGNRRGRKR